MFSKKPCFRLKHERTKYEIEIWPSLLRWIVWGVLAARGGDPGQLIQLLPKLLQ